MQNNMQNMQNNMQKNRALFRFCIFCILQYAKYASGILYTWYKAVQDAMYWYKPAWVRTLLDTRPYEKPQNGTYQYIPT